MVAALALALVLGPKCEQLVDPTESRGWGAHTYVAIPGSLAWLN